MKAAMASIPPERDAMVSNCTDVLQFVSILLLNYSPAIVCNIGCENEENMALQHGLFMTCLLHCELGLGVSLSGHIEGTF